MPASADLRFRAACPGDAQAIAALHAGSWQRHYRGAFSDAFPGHDAAGYLLPLWAARLATPDPRARTVLADRRRTVVGLVHASSARTPPGARPVATNDRRSAIPKSSLINISYEKYIQIGIFNGFSGR